jgi:hypothetical protein
MSRPLAVAGVLALCATAPVEAQGSDHAAWNTIGGGALGLYSGAVLGTLGSLIPCGQTYATARCVRIAVVGAGTVGFVSGALLGEGDPARIEDAAKAGAIGLAAGAAVGVVLKPMIQGFRWADVGSLSIVGSAAAASGTGTAIGFGVGALTGLVLWKTVPSFDLEDAAGLSLAGLAAGGLVTWLVRGIEAQSGGHPSAGGTMPLVVSFRF